MLNRRLIRIKVFKALYAFEFSGDNSIEAAENRLLESCERTRDLYYFLLNITGVLTSVARERINAGLRKFHPTEEEASPSYKFVNNAFASIVGSDPAFGRICLKRGLGWGEYDVLVRKLYASVTASDYYKEYMASDSSSLEEDCLLWRRIFEEEFEDNAMLANLLEEMSPDWTDEVAYVLNVIMDDIPAIAKAGSVPEVKVFQKPDDRIFATTLFEEAVNGYAEYSALIDRNTVNWESDRVVSTDVALTVMGIAEAVSFPTIPVKVTINEYVELSKFYSTPNSKVFVNGLLNRIIQDKLASGEITKTGRGLRE